MRHLTVERDGFDCPMGAEHDCPARRLITSPRFHTHVAILDQMQTSNAVLAAYPIELGKYLSWREILAIQCNDIALPEFQFNIFGQIGGLLRRYAPPPHGFFRLLRGVFQNTSFIRDM